MKVMETVFVVILFLLYVVLWRIKQVNQIRETGIDPKVMADTTSNVQKYMGNLMLFITVYAVAIIVFHSIQLQVGTLFSRIESMSSMLFDILGFLIRLTGLSICLYAQRKMGSSWRVGIDEKRKTELITTGLYAYIRNPTYLGMFLLNIGVWLIWPTWAVFLLVLLYIITLDIQVRCEEDYLLSVHGDKYTEYMKRTKRYLPFLY